MSENMNAMRERVLKLQVSSMSEKAFIDSLQHLIKDEGEIVCQTIFSTLTSLTLPVDGAVTLWHHVLDHHTMLVKRLARDVSLITAVSDYLNLNRGDLSALRLVEGSLIEKYVTETTHDKLTGLFNRTYFDEVYHQQVSLAKRYDTDLSILFIDIDDFKEVNDNFGHATGDNALKTVADCIKTTKRECDIAARYGGEEFILLMPQTHTMSAGIIAERIRRKIEHTVVKHQQYTFTLTISGGIASYPQDAISPHDLILMADSALYQAKGAGKNVIKFYHDEQRKFQRVAITETVFMKSLCFDSSRTYTGITKNIGLGGLLINNSTNLPLNSFHSFKLNLDKSAKPLNLIGRVVRIRQHDQVSYDMGVSFSFQEMAKTASKQIAGYIRQN